MIMKKIMMFLLFIMSTTVFGQEEFYAYEAFGVNNKYGVVNKGYGIEVIAPTYSNIDFFFNDYIALSNKDTVDFYNKTTNEKVRLQSMDNFLYLNNTYYAQFNDSTSTYLIPEFFDKKIKLPAKYRLIHKYYQYLICANQKGYDVMDFADLNTVKLHVKATDYFSYLANNKDNETLFINVFYGDKAVFVYDETLTILKTYKTKENDFDKVKAIVFKDFPEADKKAMMNYEQPLSVLWSSKFDGTHTKVSRQDKYREQFFTIKGDFKVEVVPGNTNWVRLSDKESNNTYEFRVYFDHQVFMIPPKYVESLELTFQK